MAILLGYAISLSLMGPITRMDEQLGRIASGDFSKQVDVQNRDELGTLGRNLNRMNELRDPYQQIEAASRHKSDFLASMSHELRTPLNAIIGYSEMLTEEAEEREQKDLVPDLQKIRASGKHLLALINDILDLSKIEAGRIELASVAFDMSSLVGRVLDVLALEAGCRGIRDPWRRQCYSPLRRAQRSPLRHGGTLNHGSCQVSGNLGRDGTDAE